MSDEEFGSLYEKLCSTEGIKESTWQFNPVYSAVTEELPEDFLALYREAMQDGSTGSTQEFPLYTQFIEDDIFTNLLRRWDFPGRSMRVLMERC